MKISICGKGGSGKSVIAALLAIGLKARGYRVLVVDSDESNSGLFRLLGFHRPPTPLMEMAGGKRGLKERMAVKTSPQEAHQSIAAIFGLNADDLLHGFFFPVPTIHIHDG